MRLTLNPLYFIYVSGSTGIASKHSMVEILNLFGALL